MENICQAFSIDIAILCMRNAHQMNVTEHDNTDEYYRRQLHLDPSSLKT